MAIDKAELFDLYHEWFPRIAEVVRDYNLAPHDRCAKIEEIVTHVDQKIEEAE